MKIFPAIDIKDKKCVRLIKGDFENKKNNMTHTKYFIYKLIKFFIIFNPVLSLFSG